MKTKVAALIALPALAVSSYAVAGDTLGKIAENTDVIQNVFLAILTLLQALKKKEK